MVNKLIVRSNARANWISKNKTTNAQKTEKTKLQKNEKTEHETREHETRNKLMVNG